MYEILFQYGPVTIASFNLFLALAFIVSIVYLVRFINLKKMKLSFLMNRFTWFILAPLLSGRVFYILEHLQNYQKNPLQALKVWDLDFSALGIVYGVAVVLYFFTKKDQEDYWSWLDAFTISGLAGLFVIHIGHFFAGNHYGKPTDLPWGMAFDTISIPFINPIHPTQLYSALLSLVIFAFAIKRAKRIHLSGVVGSIAIMVYSLGAFGIDFLHGSPSTYAKINYLIIATTAFIFYIHCSHKKILDESK